jgi:hypothetical protein
VAPLADYTEQASVGEWPLRILLTGLVLACVGLLWLAIRRGWRNRLKRQTDFVVPTKFGPETPESTHFSCWAKYIGTVVSTDLWDRVAAGGLAAQSVISIGEHDVRVTRQGEPDLPISGPSLRQVGVGRGMLQKAFRNPGLILLSWDWSGQAVTSGFWIADPHIQAEAIVEFTRVVDSNFGSQVKEG